MIALVIGSGLRSVSDVQEEHGMRFLEEARTAPKYRLYALDDRYAALVPDEERGISVPGELVEVPDELWDAIVATEPPGIVPGPVELEDGRIVTAALGDEAMLAEKGKEITDHGGFEAYLASIR